MSKPSSSQNAVIVADGLCKAFHRPVLKNVRLLVEEPQSVFLCGGNGAGKSTLLRILAGLLSPDDGSVRIRGRCLRRDGERVRAKLGVILHRSMVYPDLTVLENLDFFAHLYGVPQRRERIASLLEQVGLTGFRYDRASILSRGLLQRLSIARALIHRPEVLLADEPFTGLDTRSADCLINLLGAFRERGGTLILTTHEVTQGLRCADRVVVLDRARIVFDRPVSRVDHARFTKDYLRYVRESA